GTDRFHPGALRGQRRPWASIRWPLPGLEAVSGTGRQKQHLDDDKSPQDGHWANRSFTIRWAGSRRRSLTASTIIGFRLSESCMDAAHRAADADGYHQGIYPTVAGVPAETAPTDVRKRKGWMLGRNVGQA